MNNREGSNSSREKGPAKTRWIDSISPEQRKKLAVPSATPKGKRRFLPEHILRAMAKPEHRDEVLPTLGFKDGSSGAGPDVGTGPATIPADEDAPRYYSRLTVVPTARCYVCGELFKLEAIKFHRPKTLGPEQPICYFCYRDKKEDSTLTVEPTPGPSSGPASRASRAVKRVAIGIEEKSWIVASILESALSTAPKHVPPEQLGNAIDSFISYLLEADDHGRTHIDLYFDKRHRLLATAPDQLVEDFIDNIPDSVSGSALLAPCASELETIEVSI